MEYITEPEILEPEVLPEIKPNPNTPSKPQEDDPFNVPLPLIDPQPLGNK